MVAIQKNENVAGDIPWANILKDDFWGYPIDHAQSHKSYRPISTLSFRLTKDWDGHLDPRSFHAVNIVLHGMVTAAVSALAWLILRSRVGTVVAALVFATHPIHCDVCAPPHGRAELLSAFFYTCAMVVHVRAMRMQSRALRAWLAVLAEVVMIGFALFSKETG